MSSFEQNSFGSSQYQGQTESHYIDTPEQVELEFNLAGAGSRFVAVLLDHLIVFAFFLVEFLVLLLVASAAEASSVKGDERAGKWALAAWADAGQEGDEAASDQGLRATDYAV
jgi:hypothetical protein